MLDLAGVIESAIRVEPHESRRDSVHVTDLAAGLEPPEKCPRQVWLRRAGVKRRPHTLGELLMWRNAHAIHDWLYETLREHLPEPWVVAHTEGQLTGLLDDYSVEGVGTLRGRVDLILRNQETGEALVLDVKTLRGRAFSYLDAPRSSHVIQVQAYALALDCDGAILLYLDREGSNRPVQYLVQRNDEAVRQAWVSLTERLSVEPPVLEPEVRVAKRKGPDALYVSLPWQCEYCEYRDVSCPGALPQELRLDGIVGRVEDGRVTNLDDRLEPIRAAIEAKA